MFKMKEGFSYLLVAVVFVGLVFNVFVQYESNEFLKKELIRKNILMDNQNEVILKQKELINVYENIMRQMKEFIERELEGMYFEKHKDRIT